MLKLQQKETNIKISHIRGLLHNCTYPTQNQFLQLETLSGRNYKKNPKKKPNRPINFSNIGLHKGILKET